jgi:pilus assembly protein Flp/PilA
MNAIKNFINDEAGVTAIEYALMAAFLAAAVATGASLLNGKLASAFTYIGGLIKTS